MKIITDPNILEAFENATEDSPPSKKAPKKVELKPEPEPEVEESSYWGDVLENLPGSAAQYGRDMVYPFIHPGETASALGKTALGAFQKIVPGEQEYEQYADAAGQFYKDRYGSLAALKETFRKDPVGVVGDISGAVTGAGYATRGPAVLGKLPRLNRVGQAITQAGAAVDPVNLAWNAAVRPALRGGARLIPGDVPRKLYESAAKFSVGSDKSATALRKSITETAMREKIMPTPAGVRKLDALIQPLEQKLNVAIDAATQRFGDSVHVNNLFKYFDDVLGEYAGARVEAPQAKRIIDGLKNQYMNHVNKTGRAWLSAKELQDIKVDMYKKIYDDAFQKKSFDAKDAARSAVARSARESIEGMTPEVADVNRQLGEFYDLQGPLAKSAARVENAQLFPFDMAVKMGALAGTGYTVAGEPGAKIGATLGATMAALDRPRIKAGIASSLYRAGNNPIVDMLDNSAMRAVLRQALAESAQLEQNQRNRNAQGR